MVGILFPLVPMECQLPLELANAIFDHRALVSQGELDVQVLGATTLQVVTAVL